jgi:hypothetical protein
MQRGPRPEGVTATGSPSRTSTRTARGTRRTRRSGPVRPTPTVPRVERGVEVPVPRPHDEAVDASRVDQFAEPLDDDRVLPAGRRLHPQLHRHARSLPLHAASYDGRRLPPSRSSLPWRTAGTT